MMFSFYFSILQSIFWKQQKQHHHQQQNHNIGKTIINKKWEINALKRASLKHIIKKISTFQFKVNNGEHVNFNYRI